MVPLAEEEGEKTDDELNDSETCVREPSDVVPVYPMDRDFFRVFKER